MKGDIDLANYTIISAWLDGETIRYKLNNNSTWAAFNGRNIENVSNTATTISFAQGEFIKVMSLNVTSGGVSSPRTIGQRKIQRQQPETSSFQQQYDKRGSRNNSNDREINDRYGDDSEDNGKSGSIASWLARRWWIAVKKWLKYGWNGTDFPDLFFFLLPFIPFIILYYLISGIYGMAVNAVDSAADIFSSDNDKPVQTSVVTESSGNTTGELPWRLPQTSDSSSPSAQGTESTAEETVVLADEEGTKNVPQRSYSEKSDKLIQVYNNGGLNVFLDKDSIDLTEDGAFIKFTFSIYMENEAARKIYDNFYHVKGTQNATYRVIASKNGRRFAYLSKIVVDNNGRTLFFWNEPNPNAPIMKDMSQNERVQKCFDLAVRTYLDFQN